MVLAAVDSFSAGCSSLFGQRSRPLFWSSPIQYSYNRKNRAALCIQLKLGVWGCCLCCGRTGVRSCFGPLFFFFPITNAWKRRDSNLAQPPLPQKCTAHHWWPKLPVVLPLRHVWKDLPATHGHVLPAGQRCLTSHSRRSLSSQRGLRITATVRQPWSETSISAMVFKGGGASTC